jgi:hypothetical protein
MTEAAAAVERLRGDLERARGELVTARADADQRVRELQHEPTAARMLARNESVSAAELLDLQIARISKDLDEAQAAARQERIGELLAMHASQVQAVAQAELRAAAASRAPR